MTNGKLKENITACPPLMQHQTNANLHKSYMFEFIVNRCVVVTVCHCFKFHSFLLNKRYYKNVTSVVPGNNHKH